VELVRITLDKMVSWARQKEPDSHFWRTYLLCTRVLSAALGKGWLERHVLGETSPTNYFRNACISKEDQDLHYLRVYNLAEYLINLSGVRGFDEVWKLLRERPEPEPIVAELETGALLLKSGRKFRFIKPEPGESFDLELEYRGVKIAADTKCKLEKGNLSASSLVRSFEKARTQLPSGMPGIIIVKTPLTSGPITKDDFAYLDEAVEKFYAKGTNRVAAIYIYHSIGPRIADRVTGFYLAHPYPNPRDPFKSLGVNWSSLLDMNAPVRWTSLAQRCA
jgi:hypothetical protein